MAGGAVAPARVRIKGRKLSVLRFFIISVAYTITWITLSSELGYYGKLYGPQVLLQLNIAYYLPSIPVLILSSHVEKIMDKKLGHCVSMFSRLIVGMIGCGFICAYFPFLPLSLSFLLGMVMLLGVVSAIAFSTSYQIVAWFRSADTIALGLGCVGSGPMVLLIQLGLGMGHAPKRWQWIWMFEIGAGIVCCGIFCTVSLMWQYAAIISGKEPYLEKPLLTADHAPEAEEEDMEPPAHVMSMMLSPRMMSLADPFQGMPLPTVPSRMTADTVLATHDHETGTLRPVRRAASMDSDYSLSMWHAQHSREWLRSKTLNVARSNLPVTHYVSPPTSAKTQITPSEHGWDDLGSSNWSGFPSIASNIDAPLASETPTARGLLDAGHHPSRTSPGHSTRSPLSPDGSLHHLDDSGTSSPNEEAEPLLQGARALPPSGLPSLAVSMARRRQLQASLADRTAGCTSENSSDGPEDCSSESPMMGISGGSPFKADAAQQHAPQHRRQPSGVASETSTGCETPELSTEGSCEDAGALGGASPFAAVQRRAQQIPAGVPPLPTLPLPVGADPPRTPPRHMVVRSSEMQPSPDANRAPPPPPLKPAQSEVQVSLNVFKDLWTVILGSLASSTILNLVFPFFTYIPTSGLLGDYLPQVLFFTRIFADIIGRMLPRNKALTLKNPYALLVLATMELGVATGFFFYLKSPDCYQHDLVYLAIITFFWVAGGFINTNSYILAPNMVDPKLCARASAIMALTYQVAHFLGLMLAVVIMSALYGSVGHI